jgi:hypothetical protein
MFTKLLGEFDEWWCASENPRKKACKIIAVNCEERTRARIEDMQPAQRSCYHGHLLSWVVETKMLQLRSRDQLSRVWWSKQEVCIRLDFSPAHDFSKHKLWLLLWNTYKSQNVKCVRWPSSQVLCIYFISSDFQINFPLSSLLPFQNQINLTKKTTPLFYIMWCACLNSFYLFHKKNRHHQYIIAKREKTWAEANINIQLFLLGSHKYQPQHWAFINFNPYYYGMPTHTYILVKHYATFTALSAARRCVCIYF